MRSLKEGLHIRIGLQYRERVKKTKRIVIEEPGELWRNKKKRLRSKVWKCSRRDWKANSSSPRKATERLNPQ